MTLADELRAAIARLYGMHNSRRIMREARRERIGPALAYAMVEQETGAGRNMGRNVWGGDPEPNGGTTGWNWRRVTKDDYLAYKARRGRLGRGGMQGVGPMQLTWYEFQDMADAEGGCWKPWINLRIGFRILKRYIKAFGLERGIARYNGSGDAADRYATSVLAKRDKWRKRLLIKTKEQT